MSFEVAYISSLNLVITGYRGFVGRVLCSAFESNGHECVVMDIADVKYLDVLIHFAAKVDDASQSYVNNISLDLEMLQICKFFDAHLLYASTNNVYPYARDCNVMTQTKINDFYSASKIHAEELIQHFFYANTTILRLGDVFGLGQKHGNMFRAIEVSIKENKALRLYGRGLKIRSYIYLKDLIGLLQFFVVGKTYVHHGNKTYNISYAEPLSVGDIVEYVATKANLSVDVVSTASLNEKLDFRTMLFNGVDGYQFDFNVWGALDDYVDSVQQTK